jgi:hypothetical protein
MRRSGHCFEVGFDASFPAAVLRFFVVLSLFPFLDKAWREVTSAQTVHRCLLMYRIRHGVFGYILMYKVCKAAR